MKGVNRQSGLRGEHAFIQTAGKAPYRRIGGHAALGQKRHQVVIARRRQQAQPIDHALLDLPRSLARKGDRQNFTGRDAGQQQANDSRSQQPRLSAASAGLDNDAVRRIERAHNQGLGRSVRITHGTIEYLWMGKRCFVRDPTRKK